MSSIMCILCLQSVLHTIVDEMEDWKGEGAQTLLFGVTTKAARGFIYLGWSKPIPNSFYQKLHDDDDIVDYFVFNSTVHIPVPLI